MCLEFFFLFIVLCCFSHFYVCADVFVFLHHGWCVCVFCDYYYVFLFFAISFYRFFPKSKLFFSRRKKNTHFFLRSSQRTINDHFTLTYLLLNMIVVKRKLNIHTETDRKTVEKNAWNAYCSMHVELSNPILIRCSFFSSLQNRKF